MDFKGKIKSPRFSEGRICVKIKKEIFNLVFSSISNVTVSSQSHKTQKCNRIMSTAIQTLQRNPSEPAWKPRVKVRMRRGFSQTTVYQSALVRARLTRTVSQTGERWIALTLCHCLLLLTTALQRRKKEAC